jgi:YVTN family beta-propeller protein
MQIARGITMMNIRIQLIAAVGLALSCTTVLGQDSPDGDVGLETIVRSASAEAFPMADPFSHGSIENANFAFGGGTVEGDGPNDAIFTPDGTTFIIAHRESRNLTLFDANTRQFVGSVDLPGAPVALDISPDSSRAVVALVDTDNAAIVDLNTLTVINTVPIGESPGAVVIMPAGDLAVVSAAFDRQLVVIDIATGSEVRRINDIGFSQTVSFSTLSLQRITYSKPVLVDNDRVINLDRFRPNPQPAEIQFIDVRTGAVNRIVSPAANPNDVDIAGNGLTAVVAHANVPSLTILDVASETVTGSVPLPENANFSAQVAVNNDATRAAYTISNNTRVIDLVTGVTSSPLGTATLNDLITTPDGNRVVGVGFFGTVIDLNAGTNLGNYNQVVSTDIGAMSPDGSLVYQVSTTFGEDIVFIKTDGTPALLGSRLSGPDFEGDRMISTAVSADGSTVVGGNRVSGNAVVFHADGSVRAQLGQGRRVDAVGISPDGNKAVLAYGDSFYAGVIDLTTDTFSTVPMGRRGSQVVFSPDSQYAYIPVVADGDGVTRINLNTLAVDGPKIPTSNMGGAGYAFSQSSGIAISPDGSTIVVAGSFDNVITFIDANSWSSLGDTFSGVFPTFVAFSPDGSTLVATNRNDNTLSVFDVATRALVNTIPLGASPGYPVITDDGRVFVVNFNDDTVGVVDLAAGAQTSLIPFFGQSQVNTTIVGIQLDNTNDRLYVAYGNTSVTMGGSVGFAITEEGFIDVIDSNTLSPIETISLGYGPSNLAASADFSVLATGAPFGDGAVILSSGGTPCVGDIADSNGTLGASDGQVDFGDLLALFGLAGPCPGGTPGCTGDIADSNGTLGASDGQVDFGDLLALFGLAGPCP